MAKFDLLGPKSAPRRVPNLLEGGMPVGVPICSAKPFPIEFPWPRIYVDLALDFGGSMLRLWSNSSEIEEGVLL